MISEASRPRDWAVLGLEWLAAVNFRTTLIGVAPVLPLLLANEHLSHAAGGLLFCAPVLMFGLCAIPGGLLADRLDPHRLVAVCLLLLALFGALRAVPVGPLSLFLCTIGFGAAVGLGQPALPSIVRQRFGGQSGLATALYSSGFMIGALLGAGLTIPWLLPLAGGSSWRGTFLIWAGLAGVSGLAWLGIPCSPPRRTTRLPSFRNTLDDPLVWLAALLFLCANLIFFTVSSWLPSYYQSLGWSPAQASEPLVVFNLAALVAGILVPVLADQLQVRRAVLLVMVLVCGAGVLGLLIAPLAAPWLWSGMVGAGNDAIFVLCLKLPIDLAPRERVGAFAGVMLSVGYSAAMVGPLVAGLLRDASGSFRWSLGFIISVALVMLLTAALLPDKQRTTESGAVPAQEPSLA